MAKINIVFNGTNYSIEESVLSNAISILAEHCSDLESAGMPLAPGLYVDGVMTKSWDELLAENTIRIMDGVVKTRYDQDVFDNFAKDQLVGDLIISDDGSFTAIEAYAFAHCSKLTSVTIPDSITTIHTCAFYSCTSLTSVTIGNSVTSIVNDAFSDCNSALYTEESCLKYVGDSNNPYSILIGATNKNLSTYEINSQTKIIASSVFRSCNTLRDITIPDSVTSIGDEAFSGRSSLTNVTIGNGVMSIGSSAFNGCSGLTSITIPDSVTSMSSGAFYKCTGLTDITFEGTTAQWNAITKSSSWKTNVPATHVQCSDGQVAI